MITVKDLIEVLAQHPLDAEIYIVETDVDSKVYLGSEILMEVQWDSSILDAQTILYDVKPMQGTTIVFVSESTEVDLND